MSHLRLTRSPNPGSLPHLPRPLGCPPPSDSTLVQSPPTTTDPHPPPARTTDQAINPQYVALKASLGTRKNLRKQAPPPPLEETEEKNPAMALLEKHKVRPNPSPHTPACRRLARRTRVTATENALSTHSQVD